MSHAIAHVVSLPAPAVPRGARLVELVYTAVQALFAMRAPAASTRMSEAAAVRELARRMEAEDPRFAADLLAAALRHEALDESIR